MSEVKVPLKASLALAALKAQSVPTKDGADPDNYYKALQGMADNEPWTSRIIRAAKSDNPSVPYVDFGKLDDKWLLQLAQTLPRSQLQEF